MVSADGIDPNFSTTREVMSSVPPTNISSCAGGVGVAVCGNGIGAAGASVGRREGDASGVGVPVVGVGSAGAGGAAATVGVGVAGTGVLVATAGVGCVVSDGNTDCSVPPQATISTARATMPRIASPTRNPIAPNLPSPPHEGICD